MGDHDYLFGNILLVRHRYSGPCSNVAIWATLKIYVYLLTLFSGLLSYYTARWHGHKVVVTLPIPDLANLPIAVKFGMEKHIPQINWQVPNLSHIGEWREYKSPDIQNLGCLDILPILQRLGVNCLRFLFHSIIFVRFTKFFWCHFGLEDCGYVGE